MHFKNKFGLISFSILHMLGVDSPNKKNTALNFNNYDSVNVKMIFC